MKFSPEGQKVSFIDTGEILEDSEIYVSLKNDYRMSSKEITINFPIHLNVETEANDFSLLMVFCRSGQVEISGMSFTQKQQISNGIHCLAIYKDGTITFEPKGITTVRYLIASSSLLEKNLPENHHLLNTLDSSNQVFGLEFNTTAKMIAILQDLHSYEDKKYFNEILSQAKYLELLGLQMALYEKQVSQKRLQSSDISKMDLVKQVISENTDKTYTLAELAKLVGTNQQYLKRNFKIAYQTTVAQYTLLCKMTLSKKLLIESKLTISDIAQVVGYKHATHFTHAFKRFFGEVPKSLKVKSTTS